MLYFRCTGAIMYIPFKKNYKHFHVLIAQKKVILHRALRMPDFIFPN